MQVTIECQSIHVEEQALLATIRKAVRYNYIRIVTLQLNQEHNESYKARERFSPHHRPSFG